jgi:hypothetical protein
MSVEGTRRARVLALLLFAASAAYFASYARIGLYDDEGYLLEGVTRILDGQVIYRDFHHTYAPGRFYLFAGLFKLFGQDLLVVRATWVVLRAAIVVLAWLVGRRLIAGSLAWAPALALAAAPGPWHKSFFHLFLLVSLLAGAALFERGGAKRSFATGLLLALALLFRQDVGIVACASVALYLACDGLAARRSGRRTGARVSLSWLAAGLAVPIVPTLLYFGAEGALGPMLEKVLLAGARDNLTNQLPFPALLPVVPANAPDAGAAIALLFTKAIYYLPPVTFAAYAAFLAARAIRRRALPAAGEFLLALLGGAALLQVMGRSDIPHLLQAIGLVYFVWAIALAALTARLPAAARALRTPLAVGLALLFPAALTGGFALVARAIERPACEQYLRRAEVTIPDENGTGARVSIRSGERVRLDVPRARVDVAPSLASGVQEIGRFLDERTEPGDYFLTIPGFQSLYFLFDRRNPTAFPHVRRAFDSPEEEAAYIADIDRHGTRYILFLDDPFDGRPERRFRAFAPSAMQWIVAHYKPVKTVGSYVFLERIDGAT